MVSLSVRTLLVLSIGIAFFISLGGRLAGTVLAAPGQAQTQEPGGGVVLHCPADATASVDAAGQFIVPDLVAAG